MDEFLLWSDSYKGMTEAKRVRLWTPSIISRAKYLRSALILPEYDVPFDKLLGGCHRRIRVQLRVERTLWLVAGVLQLPFCIDQG